RRAKSSRSSGKPSRTTQLLTLIRRARQRTATSRLCFGFPDKMRSACLSCGLAFSRDGDYVGILATLGFSLFSISCKHALVVVVNLSSYRKRCRRHLVFARLRL